MSGAFFAFTTSHPGMCPGTSPREEGFYRPSLWSSAMLAKPRDHWSFRSSIFGRFFRSVWSSIFTSISWPRILGLLSSSFLEEGHLSVPSSLLEFLYRNERCGPFGSHFAVGFRVQFTFFFLCNY